MCGPGWGLVYFVLVKQIRKCVGLKSEGHWQMGGGASTCFVHQRTILLFVEITVSWALLNFDSSRGWLLSDCHLQMALLPSPFELSKWCWVGGTVLSTPLCVTPMIWSWEVWNSFQEEVLDCDWCSINLVGYGIQSIHKPHSTKFMWQHSCWHGSHL